MRVRNRMLLAFIVFLIAVTGVFGSETRITGMGFLGNFYIRDDFNIWDFPSTICDYRQLIIADTYLSDQLWSGGLHVPLTSTFTVGVYMSNETRDISYADTQFPMRALFYPGMNMNEAAHQFTVFGGLRMTNVDVGIFVNSFSSKFDYSDPVDSDNNLEDNLSERTYGFGLSFRANERSRFDGSIFYSAGSFSHVVAANDPPQIRDPEKYSTFGIGGRLFYAYTNRLVVVPFIAYSSGGEGYALAEDDGSNIETYVDKYTTTVVGIGADFIPLQKTLITFAAGFLSSSMTYEQTWFNGDPPPSSAYKYRIFPFLTLGLEANLTKWLGVRLSFYELIEAYTGEEPVDDTKLDEGRLTGSSYAATFGLFFKLGRFTIDTIVDTDGAADFLHYGPYILSGNQAALFTMVSIIYNFKE